MNDTTTRTTASGQDFRFQDSGKEMLATGRNNTVASATVARGAGTKMGHESQNIRDSHQEDSQPDPRLSLRARATPMHTYLL